MYSGIMGHANVVAHTGGVRGPAEVFNDIYTVFLVLGTLVGVVVIGYTLYNVVKYRAGSSRADEDAVQRPRMGELPESTGGGRKLFVSFFFSAVIVVSLIIWTYSSLLYVEDGPDEAIEVDVVGQQFGWTFTYPNGHQTTELRLPVNQTVRLNVTSIDVMHNIGIPAFNAKADAIPGQTTTTWFTTDQTGTFEAVCYELCGVGHSSMRAPVIVMEQQEFETWYANTTGSTDTAASTTAGGDQ